MAQTLADKLELQEVRPLVPLRETNLLLTTYVPLESVEMVRKALFRAGAGEIGPYQACSFTTQGEGGFTPTASSDPFLGEQGSPATVKEACLRTIVPTHCQHAVTDALLHTHPYETPLYHTHPLPMPSDNLGTGIVGRLPEPLTPSDFLVYVKKRLLRHVLQFLCAACCHS